MNNKEAMSFAKTRCHKMNGGCCRGSNCFTECKLSLEDQNVTRPDTRATDASHLSSPLAPSLYQFLSLPFAKRNPWWFR